MGAMGIWRWLLILPLAVTLAEELMDEEEEGEELEETISKEKLRALHSKFDKNGDGKVSLAEVLEFANHMTSSMAGKDVKSILQEIDTDKDGKLSLDEHLSDLRQHSDPENEEEEKELELQKKLETEKFMAADTDKDQKLDINEVAALFFPETSAAVLNVVVKDTMKARDKNGDGLLSFEEFSEVEPSEEGITVETDEDKHMVEEERKDFQKLDKDGDGVLNLEELKAWESGVFYTEAAMLRLIQTADKDGDMQATAEELENAREELASTDVHDHLMEWAESDEL